MEDTMNAEFIGNYILRGKFECLTGLHIGGSKEKLDIGGIDSPVVRDPRTRYPYVPGSSLKGKLRSLLEFGLGVVPVQSNSQRGIEAGGVSDDLAIVRLFGIGADQKEAAQAKAGEPLSNVGPSRLIVRDCHPDNFTKNWWEKLDSDLQYTEMKSENGINRITSAANPRFIERVAAGSFFEFEIVYAVLKINEVSVEKTLEAANKDLANLHMSLCMLEHNFLGKSGSRGYGRVQFYFKDPIWATNKDYRDGATRLLSAFSPFPESLEGLKRLGEIKFAITAE